MDRLKGKVAVITGGNSGIGKATAEAFIKEGAKVVISARREDLLNKAADELRAMGGDVVTVVADISVHEDAEKIMHTAVDVFGSLDILVNNAGILEHGLKPIDKVLDEDIDAVLNINTKGTMYCLRAATDIMKEGHGGSIVNVSSAAGVMGNGGAAYVSSKAAVVGLTRHTALRFDGQGIRCNAVCPGTVATPLTAGATPDNQDKDMFKQMSKHADMRAGVCMPEDVANIILFLASDESKAIDGQTIVCDFGSTL